MKLHNIQNCFKDFVSSDGQEMTEDFEKIFKANHIALQNRFSVYQNNVIKSLRDSIIATYPIIEVLVGRDFLKAMARQFVLQNLPEKGDLNLYGHNFAEFISSFVPAGNIPYLPDMARYEWLINLSTFADDDSALDITKQSPADLENTALVLRNATKLLSSEYPIETIAHAARNKLEDKIDINQGREASLIYRPSIFVKTRQISLPEYEFINHFDKPARISDFIETFLAKTPNFNLEHTLQLLFTEQILKKA